MTDWSATPCKVWPKAKTPNGYGKRKLRGKTSTAHRIEWEIVHGSIPDGIVVCHHCDNKPCYEIAHLFLGTQQDNLDDMVAKGRSTRGDRNNTTVLNDGQVLEIRRRYASGETQRALAAEYGVVRSNIQFIVQGKTWTHLLERVE